MNFDEEMIAVTASQAAKDLAQVAASAAEDKLATDIVALDVSGQFPLADIFVIASVANERQIPSVVDSIEEQVRRCGVKTIRREGEREGRWVLLDFGDIIVHVQHEQERMFYQLERLWKDCPTLPLRLGPPAANGVEPTGSTGPTEPTGSTGSTGPTGSPGGPPPR